MISGTEHQKIFVQTRDENIETKFVPFGFEFLMGASIFLQRARQKGEFECISTFEIIKMQPARKVSRDYR
jgi:hypothetical protein